ncbi:MAG: hypothetical protein R3192_04290 [Woeseiaceae bacterium]|nr:hypothetical protein [Woeseiaceae bacterium]
MALSDIADRFTAAGGKFLVSAQELSDKLDNIRAVVFDWDGVFNDGIKQSGISSGFSEADSMGTNMLRYGLWRKLGALPVSAVISGADNETAVAFSSRERFTAVYTGVRRKQDAIEHLCQDCDVEPGQIACVFDDINDLAMAEICGLRLTVRRAGGPLFEDYIGGKGLCDYLTAATGGEHAVREVCELLLGLMGCYDDVTQARVAWDENYEKYFATRQAQQTDVYVARDDRISKA